MSATTVKRSARCSCGLLRVETAGEPAFVVACHCRGCQRRSGSPFGVGAYFERAQVHTDGESRVYARAASGGRRIRNHFCPTCGTNLYWELDLRPDQIGIAVGGFVDPDFPAPTRSVWEESRHGWVGFDHPIEHFTQGTRPAPG